MFASRILFISLWACLAGCGFQPLHQATFVNNQHHTVNEALALVKIGTIADREGQILRNYLLDTMNPNGQPTFPKAKLEIVLNHTQETVSVRRDGTTERYRSVYQATVKLRDAATSQVLLSDVITASNAYYIGDSSAVSAYSTNIAEKDAREKSLRLIADQVYLLLAAYYAREDLSDHAPVQAP